MENRIRYLRKQRKLTMKQLGEVIDLAESTISQYETGKRQPDNETLLKLSEYFNVTVGYLLGVENEETPAEIGKRLGVVPNRNIIKLAGRDGSYSEKVLTDKQLDLLKALIDQLPEVTDL